MHTRLCLILMMHATYSYIPRIKPNPMIMNGKNASVPFVIRLAALASNTAIRVKVEF